MLKPTDLCRPKPGLAADDAELRALLATSYDHAAQLRRAGPEGTPHIYPTSTRFDQDRT